MKKVIIQLERKNEDLVSGNNNFITKNHEIISEHEKCKEISATSQNSVIIIYFCLKKVSILL